MVKRLVFAWVLLWAIGLPIALFGVHPSAADHAPPVEVHVLVSQDTLFVFDCWPATLSADPIDIMVVYLNSPDGEVTAYQCSKDAQIRPLLPPVHTSWRGWEISSETLLKT